MAMMENAKISAAFTFDDGEVLRCSFNALLMIESTVSEDYTDQEILGLAVEECVIIEKKASTNKLKEVSILDQETLEYEDC
tara:strand:+ start:739 stop:981 length:243 start_codon:yes stop_codon:yes gene_type:complete